MERTINSGKGLTVSVTDSDAQQQSSPSSGRLSSRTAFPFSSDGERALQRISTLGTGSADLLKKRATEKEKPFWRHPVLVPGRVLPVYTLLNRTQKGARQDSVTSQLSQKGMSLQTGANTTPQSFRETEHSPRVSPRSSPAPFRQASQAADLRTLHSETIECEKDAEQIDTDTQVSNSIEASTEPISSTNVEKEDTLPVSAETERVPTPTSSTAPGLEEPTSDVFTTIEEERLRHVTLHHSEDTPMLSGTGLESSTNDAPPSGSLDKLPELKSQSHDSDTQSTPRRRQMNFISPALTMRRGASPGKKEMDSGASTRKSTLDSNNSKSENAIDSDVPGEEQGELDLSSALGVYELNQQNIQRQLSEASTKRLAEKRNRYAKMMLHTNLNLEELRTMSWSGIEPSLRPIAWKLLSGYLPANEARRNQAIARKRAEYQGFIEQYYSTRHHEHNKQLHHQISIDLPRTCPGVALFQQNIVHETLGRLLYVWAIRHPASGYVQGINDLAVPFFVVFLRPHFESSVDVEKADISSVSAEALNEVEADTFWCLSKLLDGIQDNYTSSQPGIQRKVHRLEELMVRLDASLHDHLVKHDIQYIHFAFRWMNCMLMREMPLWCIIRMWDSYLSETNGFASLHLYICAAFLNKWSSQIRACDDFAAIITFLQSPPTQNWGDKEIEELVAEAYVWKTMFQYKYS